MTKRIQIWHDGIITELDKNESPHQCAVCGKYHLYFMLGGVNYEM
jgi:hypothetical protein